MMGSFIGYSEISNLNPQTRYFQKKVTCRFFKNAFFGGYDLENRVSEKLALWICPILWKTLKMINTQLSLGVLRAPKTWRAWRAFTFCSLCNTLCQKVLFFKNNIILLYKQVVKSIACEVERLTRSQYYSRLGRGIPSMTTKSFQF